MVRKRKKVPLPERHPLLRPTLPNQVWSMDFLFDELATGRRGEDADCRLRLFEGSVQIIDISNPALYVTRVLDQAKAKRGLPRVIRTENGSEFAGRTMQTWEAMNRSNCASSSQARRCKTHIPRFSTVASGTSARRSTGSQA